VYVYHGDDEVFDVAHNAYCSAAPLNALGPEAFKSLAVIENQLISMVGGLLGRPQAAGTATTGGSESIFLAVKSARDWFRSIRGRRDVEILVPSTVHPAFHKAAHYLDVDVSMVPVRPDQRADVAAMSAAVTDRTAMIVGSAPSYPHGLVDPISELGSVAEEHDLWFHVDACVGGFLLPFISPADRTIPAFDFRVPAVRSISVDPHKYGYALKGISLLLHRDADGLAHQRFEIAGWPGGFYATPNLTGTRAGAPMTSAWAAISHLGRPGYERLVKLAIDATDRLVEGISSVPGFSVPIAPDATLFAFASDHHDMFAIAEALRGCGWVLGVQGPPPSIHLTVSPVHAQLVERFVEDLAASAREVESGEVTAAPNAEFRYA
jgi:Glutamate decarboxylase and related PLP-dependent proteins